MNRYSSTLMLCVALLFSPLAAVAQSEADKAAGAANDKLTSTKQLPDTDLIYHVLTGEIATRRNRFKAALENYIIAARGSSDPRISQRAASIALFINDNSAALSLAQRWYALAPEDVLARRALALSLLRSGEVDVAVGHLEAVRAETDNDSQDGFSTVSALLSQVGDAQAVFQTMDRLLALQPKSRFALYYYYALAAAGVDQSSLALDRLNQALELAPDWAQAHLLRARIRTQQGDTEMALNDLGQVLAKQPKNRELRMGYARMLITAGKLDMARAEFEVMAEQNPDDADSLYALGVLAADAEQFTIAEEYLQRTLKLGHRVLDVYYELGRIAELRERYREALQWYERVDRGDRYISAQIRAAAMLVRVQGVKAMTLRMAELRLNHPDDVVSLYIAEADLLRQEKHDQQAFDILTTALQENTDNADLLYARALAAEKLDKLDILESDLRKIIAAEPDNGHALNALGYTLADRTDRYEEALGYLEKAIALLPDDAAVLDSMGWVKYRLGEHAQALQYLRRARKLNDDPEIVSHLSEVLWVIGEREEARRLWREAFEKAPDSEHLLRIQEMLQLND